MSNCSRQRWLYQLVAAGALAFVPLGPALADPDKNEQLLEIDKTKFSNPTKIDNPWWPLKPGTQYIYEGVTVEDGEKVPHRIVITVTDLTKVIDGVRALVNYDRDYKDGVLEEAELAFFAQDDEGNVWHLGEYVEVHNETELIGGKMWTVGLVEGAKAGITVQADPKPGTPSYSQGYAPPPYNWSDRGRVYKTGQKTKTRSGSYSDVVVIEEYSAEEPGAVQLKYYARGVGNVRVGWKGKDPTMETLELVKIVTLDEKALAEVRKEALQLEKRAYVYGLTPPAEQIK